jgi:hypothetical protein
VGGEWIVGNTEVSASVVDRLHPASFGRVQAEKQPQILPPRFVSRQDDSVGGVRNIGGSRRVVAILPFRRTSPNEAIKVRAEASDA